MKMTSGIPGVVQGALAMALPALACAVHGAEAAPNRADTSVPAALAVPGHASAAMFSASGVQIYRCQKSAQGGADFAWTFVAPEASLHDSQGAVAGRHYGGPTWEAVDGSKVVGKLVAKVPAPDSASIPWLLLSATVAQAGPTLGRVDFVQRLNTRGGAAPSGGCAADKVDQEARVPYTADYVFLAPQ